MGYIQELRRLLPGYVISFIPTSPDGRHANRDLLVAHADKLGKQTLLVVAGGDGTVNMVVDILLHDPQLSDEMRQTTALPFWGGNGNDLAHMLNGSPSNPLITRILHTGQAVVIHPLICEITNDGTTNTHTAICYASFGASAFAARRLESLRGMRPFFHTIGAVKFLHELSMVSRALVGAERFAMNDGHGAKTVYDLLFINGSRFAKVNGAPLKLTDKRFFRILVEQKRLSVMAYHITELIRKHPNQYAVSDDHVISFTLQDAAWAQLDGEVMRLDAGTNVRIHLATQSFYALSTLLS
jgi:diacylglycerol kinase family enzyme